MKEKIIYIDRDEIMEEFLESYPEFRGKQLTLNVYTSSYSITYRKQLLSSVQAMDDYIFKEKSKIYGYCRISTKQQSIERQERNIKQEYENAIILKEAFTGTKMDRPEWNKIMNKVKSGDTIVFDSVSRMSRNADEGVKTYFELFDQGVNLVFLKEHYIDTDTYKTAKEQSIVTTGNEIADIYIEATNRVIKLLAEKQIEKAFEQSEKEVQDLRQRTREGIETARLNGKQIGQTKARKLNVKKSEPTKELIRKYSKDFDGTLTDTDVMKLIGIARNTYYKYKKEMKAD